MSCTADENRCGDANITDAEQCDDSNILAGDGCDSSCQLETCM
jgi:cysteine-rich repeat protein